MSLTSLICAALIGSVTGQGTVVGIKQERIPFQNGRTGATFSSPIGTLTHIQTLQLRRSDQDVFDRDGLRFASIAVADDGSELLAVSSDQRGGFVTLAMRPTAGDQYDITTARAYPLVDPDGNRVNVSSTITISVYDCSRVPGDKLGRRTLRAYSVRELVPWPRFLSTVPTKRWVTQLGSPCGHPGLLLADLPNVQLTREGMAVNGRYRPGGRGDFTVAYLANPVFPQTLDVRRFRRGVRTRRSTAVDVTELNQWCGFYLAPQATIAHLGPCGDLLAICQWFPDETPGPNPRRAAVPVWVYTGNTFYTFFIEATFAYNPTGVAELSNGDIIIASVVYSNPTKLRISYITSDQLNKDIDDRFRRISPLVIADIDQADGFEIGVQSGLAVREDPRSGRIFVYSMSDDSFTPGRTLLTTFEWEPIRNPRS